MSAHSLISRASAAMMGARRSRLGDYPSTIATRFWYRADDRVDVSGVCSQLTDRSGNLRHLTQGTASFRPTPTTRAGQDCLEFDASNDRLSCAFGTSLTQPCTIYAVWETKNTSAIRVLFDGDDVSNRHFVYHNAAGSWRMGAPTELIGGTVVANQIYASALVYNTTSSSIYPRSDFVTAVATGTCGTNSIDGFTLGCGNNLANFWNGFCWEIVCVAGAQDAAARALMGTYFMSRYTGLTVTV